MRMLRSSTSVLLGAVAALAVAAAPASADKGGAVTFTGSFTEVQYAGSQAQCPTSAEPVTGSWSVTVHGQTASAYFDITDHVAYPFPNMKQAYSAGGTVFVVYGQTAAGLLTVTLYPSGELTYVIAPYNNTGLGLPGPTIVCDRVTYVGEADG